MNCKSYLRGVIVAALSISLIGCGTVTSTNTTTNTNLEETSTSTKAEEVFSNRDYEVGYDEENATLIEIADTAADITNQGAAYADNVVTISEEGTYILSGNASDFQILVSADKEAKIQLVLNNLNITNTDLACINIEEADKVFITLAQNSINSLSLSGTVSTEVKADAVIYSKCDLTLNGEGSLTLSSNENNTIATKKDLVITSGNYTIDSGKHGLLGKNSVSISNGTFDIKCKEDAVHASNSEDEGKGFVYISGGEFTIYAEDDGIHAETDLTIDGGTINITNSYEALEGYTVTINGGDINAVSSDDGINAAGGNDGSNNDFANMFASDDNAWIEINGGNIYISAEGDGLDSNGNLYVNGGTVYVDGPQRGDNGALDYNGEAIITGGVVVASGSSGMAENFGSNSTQPSIYVSTNSNVTGDVTLKDSNGNVLVAFSPTKQYNSAVISSPDLKVGESYTVALGSEEISVELTDIIYGETTGFMNFGPGGGQGGRGNKDQMPEGFDPSKMGDGQMPEGFDPSSMGDGQMPEGFDPSQLPEGFDPSKMGDGNMPTPPENSNKN